MIPRPLPRIVGLLVLFVAACNSTATQSPVIRNQSPIASNRSPVPSNQSPISTLRVGWAYEAYPEASLEKMRGDMARMRENGANAIWIGHNNPGEVDATKVEPGMSYAVYAALQSGTDPLYSDARAMADAITRALDAARVAQLRVILPIGYQIQMGSVWNRAYPEALRTKADGAPLVNYNSGYTASPYSPQYRRDITRYYEWIQREYVKPYQDVIVMLSLADEPMGGDYSESAQTEFARRYGKRMGALTPGEQWKLGEFQAGVIVDYAAWSADEWQRINPNVLTTMSFHGGETARRVWGLPDLEPLFSKTPDNFLITFDAYLHDDLPTKPALADEIAQLKLLLTTVGHYSRVYRKPVLLWGGVNAWGLAQESSAPLSIADAVTNLLLVFDLPSRMGGEVWGIFAWNYNVKQQGLEQYARPTTYDVRAMEIAVNRVFPVLRTRQPSQTEPDIAIWLDPREMWDALAESRSADAPPLWFDTTRYARAFADHNAVIVTSRASLDNTLNATYVLLPGKRMEFSASDLKELKDRLAIGTIVMASESIARELDVPTTAWEGDLKDLPNVGGVIYVLNGED